MPLPFFLLNLSLLPLYWVSLTQFSSGLARTFGRAAFARPTPVARRALQPRFPSLARFASSEAIQAGKIHQVIGAVVDGMLFALVLPPCLAFFFFCRRLDGCGNWDGWTRKNSFLVTIVYNNHVKIHSNSRFSDKMQRLEFLHGPKF